jgi:CheY-like chemotaxis protein
VIAANGKDALAALEAGHFDLVLMDIQMPEFDGFEVTRIIRARETPSGARLPIVAMTANAMKGDEERCLSAGMDGYVSKPFQAEQLLATIHRVVG